MVRFAMDDFWVGHTVDILPPKMLLAKCHCCPALQSPFTGLHANSVGWILIH